MKLDGDHGGSEEQLLLQENGNVDSSWRLNFDGFQLSAEQKEKPPRGRHDCLGVLGNLRSLIYLLLLFVFADAVLH